LADLLFTPSADGNENLLREGVMPDRIHLVGNVMIDTLVRLLPEADCTGVLRRLGLNRNRLVLVTLHRPSNVDDPESLKKILVTLSEISCQADVLFPVHPRTRQVMKSLQDLDLSPHLHLTDPLGYLEFLSLQRKAALVVTDSGGIQEESTYLGVPCLTLRENTERPITVDIGSNTLIGRDMSGLRREAERALSGNGKIGSRPPLWDGMAGNRIAGIVLSQ